MPCSNDDHLKSSPLRAPHRKWLLRGLSVLFGLSFFVVIELACILLGLGDNRLDDDPFVGFNDLQPLFERDATGENFATAEARLKFFSRDEFSAIKPTETKRIFCLGGSTVQGRPFSKETSFTTWLQLALEQAQPELNWEVINCGGISYASYRLTPILDECLSYKPDAFIVCTGHNEFLEDRSYGEIRGTSPWLTVPYATLSRLRSFRLFRQLLLRGGSQTARGDRDVLGSDVDAFLDYKDGINAYHRDDAWRRGVAAHFERNLERMIRLAKDAGVPIILVQPPSNLADSPPFKSEHNSSLTEEQLEHWNAAITRARKSLKTFPSAAVADFEKALAIDPEFAATHFELGQLHELLGNFDAARQSFLLARENDICPLRMLASLEDAMKRVADRSDVPLLNAHRLLEKKTRHGILGSSLLVDHVHPSFEGHQMIAVALVKQLQQRELVKPITGWTAQAQAEFQRHFDQLPDVYFAKGEQNLANLRYWTQGMADGPPVESRPPQKAMQHSNSSGK